MLEGLRDVHPAVDKILRFRTLSKLKSTYCEGLLKVIAADGRIHSNFNQTETRTGRISLDRAEFAEYPGAHGDRPRIPPVFHRAGGV